MTTLKNQFAELASLAQLYLFQEFSLQTRIFADAQVVEEFREYVLRHKKEAAPLSVPSTSPKVPVEPPRQQAVVVPPPPIIQKPPLLPSPKPATPSAPASKPTKIEEKAAKAEMDKLPSAFALEPIEKSPHVDVSDFRAFVSEKFPYQKIMESIPSDIEARKINQAWETRHAAPEVMIFTFQEATKHRHFLNHLCLAIETLEIKAVCSSAVKCEQENSWDKILASKNLRLVIANDTQLHTLPKLMKHYKEVHKKGMQYLDKIPLLLLPDLSFYFKEPSLKSSLWKALKELLHPSV